MLRWRLSVLRGSVKTRMRGEERHAAIVRSAIHLFAEKGFRGATTRELAASLGVTEPVLYQHFKTKRELYDAIIEAKAQQASDRVDRMRPFAESGDDRAFFTRLAEQILERYDSDPQTTRLLLFISLEGHDLAGYFFERVFRDFYELVRDFIRGRIQARTFRGVDPEIAARSFIGMIGYHGLVEQLFPGYFVKRSRRMVAREMTEIFLKGVSAAG